MRVLALCLVTACSYRAGSFAYVHQGFPGERTTAGCLDLAVEPVPDLATGNLVLSYEFGNRCDRPAVVDLASLAIIGRTSDGRDIALQPYDPDHEIRSLLIDGRAAGREKIAYGTAEAITGVCVDLAAIAHASPADMKCFSWPVVATTTAPQCNEEGDAFGVRRCPRFGIWAGNLRIRHFFMELGLNLRMFPNLLPSSSSQRQPSDVAMTASMRLAIDVGRGFYVGIDGEIGGLTEAGVLTGVAPSSGVVVAGALIAGIRGTAGPAAFALEAAAGGLGVIYSFDGATTGNAMTINEGRALLEARARAELWLDPWITAGAVVGTSVLESQDWMLGLYFGLHSRAFGGER